MATSVRAVSVKERGPLKARVGQTKEEGARRNGLHVTMALGGHVHHGDGLAAAEIAHGHAAAGGDACRRRLRQREAKAVGARAAPTADATGWPTDLAHLRGAALNLCARLAAKDHEGPDSLRAPQCGRPVHAVTGAGRRGIVMQKRRTR